MKPRRRAHWPLALLLLMALALVPLPSRAQTVRCFVRMYDFQRVRLNTTLDTLYSVQMDMLSAMPVMLDLDDMPLSATSRDRCARGATIDMLHLMWSETPSAVVPFCSLPLKCAHGSPLSFALSTLGAEMWGQAPRVVSDGQVFRPQYGRASMLTGLYDESGVPQRHRTLVIRMTSERQMQRAMPVRVCIRAAEVPYDMPPDVYEVDPPRLIPLMGCTREFGGRCSTNLGYANTAGMALDIKYPSSLNKLVPPTLENGFQMFTRFEEGLVEPALPYHVSWRCDPTDMDARDISLWREQPQWRLDGLVLLLGNARDSMCNDPTNTMQASIYETAEAAEQRTIARFQNRNPRISTQLKVPKHTAERVVSLSAVSAQHLWADANVQATHMSTAAREIAIQKNSFLEGQVRPDGQPQLGRRRTPTLQ